MAAMPSGLSTTEQGSCSDTNSGREFPCHNPRRDGAPPTVATLEQNLAASKDCSNPRPLSLLSPNALVPKSACIPSLTYHAGAEREHCGDAALGIRVAAHWPELPAPPLLHARAGEELLLLSGRGQLEA